MEFLMQMEYWHWLVLGLILLILEMFAPGAILLWFGVAGLVVGVLQLAFGEVFSPQIQWLVFSILSVVSIVGWKAFAKKNNINQDDDEKNTLNKRGKALIGKEFNLSRPIVNGVGKAKVGDTHWRVLGPDTDITHKVRVTGFEGASLVVEPIS